MEIGLHGIDGDRRFGLFDAMSGAVAAPEQEARWRPALFLRSALDGHGVWVEFPSGERLYWKIQSCGLSLKNISDLRGNRMLHGRRSTRTLTSDHQEPIFRVAASLGYVVFAGGPSADGTRHHGGSSAFRANVLLETEDMAEFPEHSWIGHIISIGGLDLKVTEATKRCGMTLAAHLGFRSSRRFLEPS